MGSACVPDELIANHTAWTENPSTLPHSGCLYNPVHSLFEDLLARHPRFEHAGLVDVVRRHLEQVLVDDDEVGLLARFERTEAVFAVPGVGGVEGEAAMLLSATSPGSGTSRPPAGPAHPGA